MDTINQTPVQIVKAELSVYLQENNWLVSTQLYASGIYENKGPFIFYEVGGAGGIWGWVTEKKRP